MVAEGKRGLLYAAAKNSDKMIAELPSAERGLARGLQASRPASPGAPKRDRARDGEKPHPAVLLRGARRGRGRRIDPVTPKSREAPPRLQKDDRGRRRLTEKARSRGSVPLETRLDPDSRQRAAASAASRPRGRAAAGACGERPEGFKARGAGLLRKALWKPSPHPEHRATPDRE